MFFRPSQNRYASRPASSHNPSTANSILSEDETFTPKEMIYTDSEEKTEKMITINVLFYLETSSMP